jgi:hypothetical protein
MSTAFHLETNEQIEIVNQETKRFIRAFTNYQQDNWDEWLLEGEAVINSNPSTTTGISPFMGMNGYEPQMSFDLQLDLVLLPPKDTKETKECQRVKLFAKEIKKRSEFLRQQIALA